MSQIFYIQSYDLNANIGKAYNEHIKHLPADCWVCITDHDSNFLLPDFGRQLHTIVQRHGNEFALFGCVTNRLGGTHQLYNHEFSNDFDIFHHYRIAQTLFSEHYAEVNEASGVAGVCMLFRKSTWDAVGGFQEGIISADTEFNKAIRAKNIGKIGIMKGVYMFHCYRIHERNHRKAQRYTKHLLKNKTDKI